MISATDILAPVGQLNTVLFAGVAVRDVRNMVDGWIDDAYAAATVAEITDAARRDEIARAWTYYRGYEDAIDRIVSSPTSVTLVDKGSGSYSSKQLDILQAKADRWRAAYDTLIAGPVDVVNAALPGTGTTRARFSL